MRKEVEKILLAGSVSLLVWITLCAQCSAAASLADSIRIELATEPRLQITAPQEWLQLLRRMGLTQVRVRGARSGEQPSIEKRGTATRPRFHVMGILTTRGELILPGKKFRQTDRAKLKDYFEQVAADGLEGVTAPRGRWGLNERQLNELQSDLTQPIRFSTHGTPLRKAILSLEATLAHPVVLDPSAAALLSNDAQCELEVQGFTAGTGLALVLRGSGLAVRPAKARGEPVKLHVEPLSDRDTWPAGHEPPGSPRQAAPKLFEFINAQISGYSLQETIDAIQPRLGMEVFFDPHALAKYDIDPDQIQINLPQSRTYYKRILDRAVSQAQLHGYLRIDEAGKTFFWITRK